MESTPEPRPTTTSAQPAAQPAPQARPAPRARASRGPDDPGSGLADPYTPLPSDPAPRGLLSRLWAFIRGLFS